MKFDTRSQKVGLLQSIHLQPSERLENYRAGHGDESLGDRARTDVSENGFTRTDAVTVLATSAVLFVLVFAASANLPDRSLRAVCLDNLRAAVLASTLYAYDHNDAVPHPGRGTGGAGPDSWLYSGAMLLQDTGPTTAARLATQISNQLAAVRGGLIWPYFNRPAETFMCPEDHAEFREFAPSFYLDRYVKVTSYVMNTATISFGRLSRLTHRLSEFPADGFWFWEVSEGNPFFLNDSGSEPFEGLTGRHGLDGDDRLPSRAGGGGHVGLFGGGAHFIPMQEYIQEAGSSSTPVQVPPPNRAWCAPLSSSGR